jgi:hypothetical protein
MAQIPGKIHRLLVSEARRTPIVDKLKLVLGSGNPDLNELIRMYRALTGREPTAAEIEEVRKEMEKEDSGES